MRIVFTNFGTRGDFQPLVALAKHVRDQGHLPCFAIPAFAAGMIAEFGLHYSVVTEDLSDLRNRINHRWIMEQDSFLDAAKLYSLLAPFASYLPTAFEELLRCCREADLLISGPAQPLGRVVHDYTGIPFVSVQFSHFGGSGGPALRVAGELLVNPFRRRLGLYEVRDPLTTGSNSPLLALYAVSPLLQLHKGNWPASNRMTGFWFNAEDRVPDPELRNFVEAGPPPIVVTFGSMTHITRFELTRLITKTCELTSGRAIVQHPTHLGQVSESVFVAGYVPHNWLFPRAAAVVLHGGAGTTAALLRAGVPGIFVPHLHDQVCWAQIAKDLGCALDPIPISDLAPRRLATAVQGTIGSETIHSRAAEVGRRIRSEKGICTAWKMITELLENIGVNSSVIG